jgi:acyl carrier protein phosphodiesterase
MKTKAYTLTVREIEVIRNALREYNHALKHMNPVSDNAKAIKAATAALTEQFKTDYANI